MVSTSVTVLPHLQAGTFFSYNSSISAADRLKYQPVSEDSAEAWTNSPFCLGNAKPHTDTDWSREGGVDECCTETKREKHWWGCVACSNTENGVDEEGNGTGTN